MKRKIKIAGISLFTLFVLTFSFYLINRHSYSKELPYYPITVDIDTVLTVGIIGDSWVAGENLDSLIKGEFKKQGKESIILSSGHSGAKSKLIYQNIFKDRTDEHSSKFVIEARPDYCVVIAGVNDSQGQVGSEFYSQHVTMIIKTLLHYKIKPVVVELPEFGIIKATNDMNFINKYRNMIFAKFNNKGEVDNIKIYRKELNDLLTEQKLINKIIFVGFDKVCSDYDKCEGIYISDGVHLNDAGNKLLSKVIVDEILK